MLLFFSSLWVVGYGVLGRGLQVVVVFVVVVVVVVAAALVLWRLRWAHGNKQTHQLEYNGQNVAVIVHRKLVLQMFVIVRKQFFKCMTVMKSNIAPTMNNFL